MGYEVFYKKAQGHSQTQYKVFNASQLQGIVDGLNPFTVYELNIVAFTIKGDGPPTFAITVKTEEEGVYVSHNSWIIHGIVAFMLHRCQDLKFT